MTEEELRAEFEKLEAALENFEGIEKVQKRTKLFEIDAELRKHVLDDVLAELEAAPTVDLESFRQQVNDAIDATKAREAQAQAFDKAVGFLTRILGLPF